MNEYVVLTSVRVFPHILARNPATALEAVKKQIAESAAMKQLPSEQAKTALLSMNAESIMQSADKMLRQTALDLPLRQAVRVIDEYLYRKMEVLPVSKRMANALARKEAVFLVIDQEETQIFCGEWQGNFQEKPSRELMEKLKKKIPWKLYERHGQANNNE